MSTTDPEARASQATLSRAQIEERLLSVLVDRGLVDAAGADAFTAVRGRPGDQEGSLAHRIVREGHVPEREVTDALAAVAGIPVINLAETRIDTHVLATVPARVVARSRVMPIRRDGNELVIASDTAPDVTEADRLRLLLDRPLQWVLATPTEIRECINHYYGVGLRAFMGLTARGSAEGGAAESPPGDPGPAADVMGFTHEIMHEAVHAGATDIHIEPYEDELAIRFRIDGTLYPVSLPAGIEAYGRQIISGLKVMGQMNVAEHRLPQDGRFQLALEEGQFDIRMSVLPTRHGEAVNLRILNRASTFLTMEQLGIRPDQRKAFDALVTCPHGMVPFTGPTGSGKSTSLYAALAELNTQDRKIITLEDPVEYEMKGIIQLPVNPDIGFTFASGLRSILRHDPDVVLVGEIRDNETAEIAISSSLTGHLVFSTLHTNDAVSAVTRLIDMGIEPYLVASSLRGVVAQRLARRICPHCREATDVGAIPGEAPVRGPVYRATGCPHCRFTGYRGRQAIFEIVTMTDELASLAAGKAPTHDLRRQALADGLVTLRKNGRHLIEEGSTTIEEILRITEMTNW